jgi:hypothetical protein
LGILLVVPVALAHRGSSDDSGWDAARNAGTLWGYRAYLEQNTGEHAAEAKRAIEERLGQAEASLATAVPDGPLRDRLRALLDVFRRGAPPELKLLTVEQPRWKSDPSWREQGVVDPSGAFAPARAQARQARLADAFQWSLDRAFTKGIVTVSFGAERTAAPELSVAFLPRLAGDLYAGAGQDRRKLLALAVDWNAALRMPGEGAPSWQSAGTVDTGFELRVPRAWMDGPIELAYAQMMEDATLEAARRIAADLGLPEPVPRNPAAIPGGAQRSSPYSSETR